LVGILKPTCSNADERKRYYNEEQPAHQSRTIYQQAAIVPLMLLVPGKQGKKVLSSFCDGMHMKSTA